MLGPSPAPSLPHALPTGYLVGWGGALASAVSSLRGCGPGPPAAGGGSLGGPCAAPGATPASGSPSPRSSSRLSSFRSEVSSGSGGSVAAESQRPDAMDVFMPAGDIEAALRLAVVSIEPPNAFINATTAVQAAMLPDLGPLSFDTVPSSVGVCYLRFTSWADREEAIASQPLPYQGACIDLHREELYGRVPQRARQCALLAVTGFPAEFVTPTCIPAAFSGFGRVLEVDPRALSGQELTTIRLVVLLERTRDIPCDV